DRDRARGGAVRRHRAPPGVGTHRRKRQVDGARMRLWTIVPGALAALVLAPGPAGAAAPAVPVVPLPAEVHGAPGTFTLTAASRIVVHGGAQAHAVADQLAAVLRPSTGFSLPIVGGRPGSADIELQVGSAASLGREGYQLDAGAHGLRL